MKPLKELLITLLIFSFFSAKAQTDTDNKIINEVYTQAMKAFENQDAKGLTALFSETATHITPMGDIVRGKEVLLNNYVNLFKMFAQMPKPNRSTSEVLNQENRYLTPELLLSTYTQKDTHFFGTEKKVEEMTYVVLLAKKSGKWLIESLSITPKVEMPMPPSTPKN